MSSDSKDFKIKITTEGDTSGLQKVNAELDTTEKKLDKIENKSIGDGGADEFEEAMARARAKTDDLGKAVGETKDNVTELGDEFGGVEKRGGGALQGIMGKLGLFGAALAALGPIAYDVGQKIGQWLNGGKTLDELNKEADLAAENFGKINSAINKAKESIIEYADSIHKAGDEITRLKDRTDSMNAADAERKRNDKVAESAAGANKASIKNDPSLTDVERAQKLNEAERAELERKASRENEDFEIARAHAQEKRDKAKQDQDEISGKIAGINKEIGQQGTDSADPAVVKESEARIKALEKEAKELINKFNELEKSRDAAGRDLTKINNDQPAAKKISENKLAEFDATADGSLRGAQQREAAKKAADDKRTDSANAREDGKTAKGLQGQDKAAEKDIMGKLGDLGKAVNKDSDAGKKAAAEIKAAIESLKDGGTGEELANVGNLLQKFSTTQDANVSKLITVAESAVERASALEARIKALETKATRNAALN